MNKIKKAKTDPLPMPSSSQELVNRPEARNLISIYTSLNNSTLEKTIQEFSGKNFSIFKENLSQILVDKINPISVEIKKLLNEANSIVNTVSVEQAKLYLNSKEHLFIDLRDYREILKSGTKYMLTGWMFFPAPEFKLE